MKRVLGLDLLKILSCFAVIILHVCGLADINNFPYSLNTGLYYMAGFAVPVFFMVNGNLLLNKTDISIRYVLSKIIRILAVTFSWNMVLFFERFILYKELSNPLHILFNSFIQKEYFWQFWFFYALIMIYLLVPLIHYIFSNYIKLALLITIALVFFSIYIDLSNIHRVIHGQSLFQANILQPYRLWTWLSYYLLGGLIGKFKNVIQTNFNIYFNAASVLVMFMVVNIYEYLIGHYLYHIFYLEFFYDNIFVIALNISFFILIYRIDFSRFSKPITILSNNIMGIYIIHVSIIKFATSSLHFYTAASNVLLIFIVFAVSLTFSLLISKIPLINKMIQI